MTKAKEKKIEAEKQIFLQMIEFDKGKLQTCLQSIDATLAKGGRVYKTCLDFGKLTTPIDKQLSDCRSNLIQISNSYNRTVNITSSLDGTIFVVIDQILKLEKHRDSLMKRSNEFQNLIEPS